ncbi:hypothetical protein J2S77_002803 [Alkalibacillus salilacus]|uniref:DUF3784 domain-containing protein n=1 Tax=Alkalibacillus salilacus TaxID=284582 RepID=A0ABT9VIJ8_9BACI|nr:hypothetical protein [Alkalibacillus salilacus]
MFAQLIIGTYMITLGFLYLFNKGLFLVKDNLRYVSDERSYLRRLALSHFLLGTLILIMAFVEEIVIFETSTFVTVYILAAIIPLTMILLNNNKHVGKFLPINLK